MKGCEFISIDFWMSFIFVVLGFIIMAINIKKYSEIYRNFKFLSEEKREHMNIEVVLHRILMFFFLLGYLLVAIGILLKEVVIGVASVGLILFFGSIFVFVGIRIQSKMLEMINETYIQTIKALISAIEYSDAYTSGHSEHVSNLCELICSKLSKECNNKNMIQFAALLHDIGKIGIPKDILYKSEKLNDEEFNIIKTHPNMGKNIIQNVNGLKEISQWILYHHERIDGNGYYNVVEEDIPLEARIIAIADTFSALVTNRPYRKGMKYEEAIKIMKKSAGSQLDTEILEVFMNIHIEELDKCMPKSLDS